MARIADKVSAEDYPRVRDYLQSRGWVRVEGVQFKQWEYPGIAVRYAVKEALELQMQREGIDSIPEG